MLRRWRWLLRAQFSRGGYSGLNPVYAADASSDVTYNASNHKLQYSDSGSTPNDITNINGVIIGVNNTSGTATAEDGRIEAKNIFSSTITASAAGFNALTIQTTPNGNSITMHEGAITATGNVTARQFTVGTQSITADKISGYDGVVTAVGNDSAGLVKEVNDLKTAVGDTDSGLVQKTTGITYDSGTQTTTIDKNATVGGTLTVTGASTFTGETTFSGGIKTNKISEATDGEGVTVDGVTLKDGGISAAGGKFNVETDGTVKVGTDKFTVDGTTGNTTVGGMLDVTGATTLKDTLTVTGATTLKNTLTVTGKTTLKDELEVEKGATIKGGLSAADGQFIVDATKGDTTIKGQLFAGANGTEFTVDANGAITADSIKTKETSNNSIGGITLSNGALEAKTLKVTDKLEAAKFDVTNLKVNDTLTVGTDTTLTDGTLKLGTDEQQQLTAAQLKNINSVIKDNSVVNAANGSVIGGVTFNAGNVTGVKDLTANGNITAKKVTAEEITDGTATLKNGALTGLTSVKIGGTTIDSTGINTNKLTVGIGLNATTIDESNGIVSAKGEIGAVKFAGAGKLENVTSIDGVSVAQNSGSANGGLTFGSNAIIGATGTPFQSTGFKVDDDGDVEGKTFTTAADGSGNKSILASGSLTIDEKNTWTKDAGIIASNVKVASNELKNDGLHVGTNTTVKDGEMTVGTGNTWSMANGITASKAGINGVTIGETEGKATFNNAGKTTIIDGDKITTGTITADKLLIDNISLGREGNENITINKDGNVTTKGEITITDAAGNVMTKLAQDSATFGKDTANQTVIDKGTIKAKATSDDTQQAEYAFDEKGLTVSGKNAGGETSSFNFNAMTGANTFTGQDKTFTTINGSSVRSYNKDTGAGHLNGATLNLWKDNNNSTYMTAGGVTFNGAAGSSAKHGTTTTIDGGTITTDTLKVERIELGENLIDTDGNATNPTFGANLSMDKQGNLMAGNDRFTIQGADKTNAGAMNNIIGDKDKNGKYTQLNTDIGSANMEHKDAAGNVSKVSVSDNNAKMSTGENASVSTSDGKVEIKGGTQTVTTTKDGTVFENINHNTTFGSGSQTTTIINGNEIKTGRITTDELVITGKGNATGPNSGTIALGGDGSIKSNIKDGDNETTFETKDDGVTTNVTDGTNTTNNEVKATGNTNTVTNGTYTSDSTQTATSIGGVVTNGTVRIAQKLDGENGKITNEVTDADGKSSKLVQNGTGLEYTDSTKADNATRINSGDVSIGAAFDKDGKKLVDDGKEGIDRINLSDLGQIDDLDAELKDRPEYKNGGDVGTAVGGINAEAAIRREEIARLDNRIDDVNDRVNKVGAMAAAIASLKSIGYDPQAPSEFSVGLGQYKGETGVAMGFFHYPNKNFMINVSLSTAGGETMGGIGATWRFGHKSPQKLLDEQRAAQAKKELAAAEKYKAAAQLAKEAQERAEYAAKLARQAQVSADNAKAAADATQAKHFSK